MHELIPIASRQLGTATMQTVNAADLHAFLGVKTEVSHWIKRRIDTFGFLQDIDYTEAIFGDGPTKTIQYFVSIDMAKELSMVERTKKGKEARQYFLACERALKTQHQPALDHFPELRAIVQLAHSTAEARLIAEHAQAQAEEAERRATIAETKADMALAEVHRMTVEHFIIHNGLLHQFPLTQIPRITKWLKDFCYQYALYFDKQPVYGKPWPDENAYPLHAFSAWLRYEQHRPQQQSLRALPKEGQGNG